MCVETKTKKNPHLIKLIKKLNEPQNKQKNIKYIRKCASVVVVVP